MDRRAEPLFDFVKRNLAATRGRWPDVAEGSGVPISTLRKIAQGQIADPAVTKVQAIADYFIRQKAVTNHQEPVIPPDPSPESIPS